VFRLPRLREFTGERGAKPFELGVIVGALTVFQEARVSRVRAEENK